MFSVQDMDHDSGLPCDNHETLGEQQASDVAVATAGTYQFGTLYDFGLYVICYLIYTRNFSPHQLNHTNDSIYTLLSSDEMFSVSSDVSVTLTMMIDDVLCV